MDEKEVVTIWVLAGDQLAVKALYISQEKFGWDKVADGTKAQRKATSFSDELPADTFIRNNPEHLDRARSPNCVDKR